MRSRLGSLGAATAIACLCAATVGAQTLPPPSALTVAPDGAPVCTLAMVMIPPATRVRALPGAAGVVRLVVSTLTDPPLPATAAMVGGEVHVRIAGHGARYFCEVPLRVTGVPAGAHPVVIEVDTGRGAPVEVARATVAVR